MFKQLLSKLFPALQERVEANHFYFEQTKQASTDVQNAINQGEQNYSTNQPATEILHPDNSYLDKFYGLLFSIKNESQYIDPISEIVEKHILELLRKPGLIIDALPIQPNALNQIFKELNSPNFEVDRLLLMIAKDPVIAAKVLELANSIYYNRSNKTIVDLKTAFMLLGQKGVMEGVIRGLMLKMVPKSQIYYQNYGKHIWQHSELTARVSEILAHEKGLNHKEAYLLGLLLNLGNMVIFQLMIDAFSLVSPDVQPNSKNIKNLIIHFGARLTLDIAKLWHFPRCILEILLIQTKILDNQTLHCFSQRFPLAGVIFEAKQVAMLVMLEEDDFIDNQDLIDMNQLVLDMKQADVTKLISQVRD